MELPAVKENDISKLNRHAESHEFSAKELEIVLDVLANHYEDLDENLRAYYESLLSSWQGST